MLVIRAIKLLVSKSRRPRALTRVRIGYQSNFCHNKTNPRLIDGKIVEWREDMTFPLFFNKPLEVQFYPKHEFGFNPEQLDSVCTATLKISDFKREVLDGEVRDGKGHVVGKFQVQYQVHNTGKNQEEAQDNLRGQVLVSSLLTHFNQVPGESGFLQMQIGNQTLMTPSIQIIAGEMLWVQKTRMPFYSENIQGALEETFNISAIVDGEEIAKTVIKIKEIEGIKEKFKKLPLVSTLNGEECGIVFVDLHFKKIQAKKKIKKELPLERTTSKSSVKLPSLHSFHRDLKPRLTTKDNDSRKIGKSEPKLKYQKQETEETQITAHTQRAPSKNNKRIQLNINKYNSDAKRLLLFKLGDQADMDLALQKYPVYSKLLLK